MRSPSYPSSKIASARKQSILRNRLPPHSRTRGSCSLPRFRRLSHLSASRGATLPYSSPRRSSSQRCTETPYYPAGNRPHSPRPRSRPSILAHPPFTTHTHTTTTAHPSSRELSIRPGLTPYGPGCMMGWLAHRSQLCRPQPAAHGLGTSPIEATEKGTQCT